MRTELGAGPIMNVHAHEDACTLALYISMYVYIALVLAPIQDYVSQVTELER